MASSIDGRNIGAEAGGSNLPAVILAGGQATRMGGGDKALLAIGGRTVLDHVLDRLRPQLGPIALNANGDPSRFAAWGVPVLADVIGGQPGPLAGVLTAMVWGRRFSDTVLTWPGDAPYPPVDLVARLNTARLNTARLNTARLYAALTGRVVCAASGGRLHPTIALWPVDLADTLADWLARGERRVSAFAEAMGVEVVAWPVPPDPFVNLNTPADVAAAEAAAP